MDHQITLQDLLTVLVTTIIITPSPITIAIQDRVITTQDQLTMGTSRLQDLHLTVILGQVTVHPLVHHTQEVEAECHLVVARQEVVNQEDNFKKIYYEM